MAARDGLRYWFPRPRWCGTRRSPDLELAGIDRKGENRTDAVPWFATYRREFIGRNSALETKAAPFGAQGQRSRMGSIALGALPRILFRSARRRSRQPQALVV